MNKCNFVLTYNLYIYAILEYYLETTVNRDITEHSIYTTLPLGDFLFVETEQISTSYKLGFYLRTAHAEMYVPTTNFF